MRRSPEPWTAEVSLSRQVWHTGVVHAPWHEAQVPTVPPQRLHIIMPLWSASAGLATIPGIRHLATPDPGDGTDPGSDHVGRDVPANRAYGPRL